MKVHCFFEQSGTFNRAFNKFGFNAFDYDIKNNFNCTDFVVDLFDNIEFTGLLNQDEIAKRYLKSNVFVLSSYTENESNSLSEAKILGVPSVCSYVGGVTQRVHHGEDGFLYPCNEAEVLAYYVDKIFGDDSLAKKFSKNSIKNIKDVVDVKKNCNEIVKIYNSILKDEV